MELFLTSSIHAVAHDIAKRVDLPVSNKLVFIDTAAEPKWERSDMTWLKNDRQALVTAGFEVTDYTITGKAEKQLADDLQGFAYIYMCGGDTVYLLEQSQKSGFLAVIKDLIRNKGKIYIGTSAGSIIAGPKLPDYFASEAADLENQICYNFVNFTILPHWGSENFKDRYLNERLKIVYRDNQVPLLLLTNNQYVHIKDDAMEIVDVNN
ncbi:MAG: Type 1 glutamine amidotransferase-like domain-containing protein [Candidatus Komeilibacteria bacterium]